MRMRQASRIEEIAERVVAVRRDRNGGSRSLKGGGKNRFVRISIDKPEGVTHGDCELISHQVGTILDVEDVVPGGTTRWKSARPEWSASCCKPRGFREISGKKAKITLREPIENAAHLGRHSGRIRRWRDHPGSGGGKTSASLSIRWKKPI